MAQNLKPGYDFIGISTPFYCNDGKGNFLLHKRGRKARDEQGKWDFGGGQLHFGEEVQRGVLREIKEEWGVEGKIQEQIPAHSILRIQNGRKTHWLAIPFFIKVDIKKARIMEPEKFSEMGIFTLNNLPRPLHSGAKYTMGKYRKYFKKYKIKH
jgi:ADP-ribose pyrophosphatase YjhB (NUDIX family)